MKSIKKINRWLNIKKKKIYFSVEKKNISILKKWVSDSNKIYHTSGKFFQILGIRVKSNFFINNSWDQPVIYQNEKGILGIIRYFNKGRAEYLLQAKAEPGNINKLQLSPTVQATKSNYNRVHSGKRVQYLNFFKNLKKKDVLINSLQSEQGGRYLHKYNRNIMINVKFKIKPNANYIWLSKQNICESINKNNFLNMDTVSVFSCAIKKKFYDFPKNSTNNLNAWFKKLKKRYFIKRKIIPLADMRNWNYSKKNINHKSKKYFSVIGVKIKSNSREISEWEQPIIKEINLGLSGFIVKKINSTYHYLVRFSLKPGLSDPRLTCTVRTSDAKNCLINKNYSSLKDNDLMKHYMKKYFIKNNNGKIIYNKIHSDEGGRFFHSQSKNIIVEINGDENIRVNSNYIWMSHNQVLHFLKRGIFNIEARILFTCFNIKNIL